jgi:hypothetical protein
MILSASLVDQLNHARGDNGNNEIISNQNSSVLDEQLQTLSATVPGIRGKVVKTYNTTDSLNTDKELAEAIANHLSEAEDSALTQLESLKDRSMTWSIRSQRDNTI